MITSSIIPDHDNDNHDNMPQVPTFIPNAIFKKVRDFVNSCARKIVPEKYRHFFDSPISSPTADSNPPIVRNTDFVFYTLVVILITAIIVLYYLLLVKWRTQNEPKKNLKK